jgi:hypothetical protein
MFLLEATQFAMASKQQRLAMQSDPRCGRLLPRSPRPHCAGPEGGALSAFTSYIARDDLATAISKYRASNCRDAYYLLTEVRRGCTLLGGAVRGALTLSGGMRGGLSGCKGAGALARGQRIDAGGVYPIP